MINYRFSSFSTDKIREILSFSEFKKKRILLEI
jgi:hypothetical protein